MLFILPKNSKVRPYNINNFFIVPYGEKMMEMHSSQRKKISDTALAYIKGSLDQFGLNENVLHFGIKQKKSRKLCGVYYSTIWAALKTIKLLKKYKECPELFSELDKTVLENVLINKSNRYNIGGVWLFSLPIFNVPGIDVVDKIDEFIPGLYDVPECD